LFYDYFILSMLLGFEQCSSYFYCLRYFHHLSCILFVLCFVFVFVFDFDFDFDFDFVSASQRDEGGGASCTLQSLTSVESSGSAEGAVSGNTTTAGGASGGGGGASASQPQPQSQSLKRTAGAAAVAGGEGGGGGAATSKKKRGANSSDSKKQLPGKVGMISQLKQQVEGIHPNHGSYLDHMNGDGDGATTATGALAAADLARNGGLAGLMMLSDATSAQGQGPVAAAAAPSTMAAKLKPINISNMLPF
jgi:hypothetical protein